VHRLSPLKASSLKQQFIHRFEQLIISGFFPVGQRLPPERELAKILEVSRPVVHEGLVELSAKGLVSILPRRGTVVNDFRQQGSVELLGSLLSHGSGELQPNLLKGVLEMRLLFECDLVRQAARHHSEEEFQVMRAALSAEEKLLSSGKTPSLDYESFALADYAFHHSIALASGNMVYPLLMNSFRQLYLGILNRFYRGVENFLPIVKKHQKIVAFIEQGDAHKAGAEMERLLKESEIQLEEIIRKE
jgi:GntR family transcriptional regulator, transcriptional repressor for pyruvate dehydrogenase complex